MVRSKTRYNQRYFVCDHCALSKPIVRRRRPNQETPPEKEVRLALQACAFKVHAEYPLGSFIYDFAVPKLRLLLEIDSKTYHRLPAQRKRDRVKTAHAVDRHWKLVRLTAGAGVGASALAAVFARAEELQ